ncbi:hypothetical protein KBA73_05490, partial [Patescibacteria group bacterium]|nr:hypothetical protein [Patescibacteria group bacterium]
MPSSPSSSLPTWWLNIWIAVGTVAFVLLIVVPMLMFSTFSRERYRFDQCEANRRDDCKPSMIWYLSGWMTLEPKAGTNSSTTTMTASSTGMVATSTQDMIVAPREVKTSDKAPQMQVIQPKGFMIVNGVYMAAAGTST